MKHTHNYSQQGGKTCERLPFHSSDFYDLFNKKTRQINDTLHNLLSVANAGQVMFPRESLSHEAELKQNGTVKFTTTGTLNFEGFPFALAFC